MQLPTIQLPQKTSTRVIVASTVMLSFISFWRAAAIVLADLASSAYYVGGDSEQVIGKSAPWFILAVMLFSYAVRALYIESSAMYVRGGVYRVVKEAMGGTMAKLSVAALMFDYVLTGPISGVAAGQYMAGFVHDLALRIAHQNILVSDASVNAFSALFAIAVTIYFWWKNIQGMHESSGKALRIMQITTVMVVLILVWCLVTLAKIGLHWPPAPTHIEWKPEALGWLKPSWVKGSLLLSLLVGFGHSVLAMSGEETLAQVNREIESPKLKNLKRAGLVIFIYSLLFTGLVSLFAVMIIPDSIRPQYYGNLISGLAMHMVGPYNLRLLMQGFVVLVGALILSGAVNTAIVGSNGVMNRISEDRVLTPWFLRPHKKYGTTYRIINLVTGLQVLTIVVSGGNVYLLAALYAFGVVWSFAFNSLSVLVLRYTDPQPREFKVPGNLRIGKREFPIGVGLITLVLFALALVNLMTKTTATKAGLTFSLGFYLLFVISEKITARQAKAKDGHIDEFQVTSEHDLDSASLQVRPGNVLVAVRDYNHLGHLQRVLQRTDTDKQDVVVVTIRILHGEYSADKIGNEIEDYEQRLFTRVVAEAERAGKPVSLLVVPGTSAFDALVQTAARLRSETIIAGKSRSLPLNEQGAYTGRAWEELPEPRPRLRLEVFADGTVDKVFYLGPHAPRLRDEDIAVLHALWLELVSDPEFRELHHYDVVSLALQRLRSDLNSDQRADLLATFKKMEKPIEKEVPIAIE
jgi:amino acid transporter/nucleotide-binding universal stress UspA family protein